MRAADGSAEAGIPWCTYGASATTTTKPTTQTPSPHCPPDEEHRECGYSGITQESCEGMCLISLVLLIWFKKRSDAAGVHLSLVSRGAHTSRKLQLQVVILVPLRPPPQQQPKLLDQLLQNRSVERMSVYQRSNVPQLAIATSQIWQIEKTAANSHQRQPHVLHQVAVGKSSHQGQSIRKILMDLGQRGATTPCKPAVCPFENKRYSIKCRHFKMKKRNI